MNHQEINTTNFIESQYKKLKYAYLEVKQNHRIDNPIWILQAALRDAGFRCEAGYPFDDWKDEKP